MQVGVGTCFGFNFGCGSCCELWSYDYCFFCHRLCLLSQAASTQVRVVPCFGCSSRCVRVSCGCGTFTIECVSWVSLRLCRLGGDGLGIMVVIVVV